MRKVSLFFICLCLVLTVPVVCQGKTRDSFCAYVVTSTKVKSSPKSGKTIGVLSSHKAILVTKVKDNYYGFHYYGKTGWIASKNTLQGNKLKTYVLQHPSLFVKKAKVINPCSVYKFANKKSKVITKTKKEEQYLVTSIFNNWARISYDGHSGYVMRSKVKVIYSVSISNFIKLPTISSNKRANIVNYAIKFLGNPYLWGGNNLISGVDCSGFVREVLKPYGVNLPRASSEQAKCGKTVSINNLKQGDLLFYKRGSRIGHVSMYIGNGKMIHAKGRHYGIVIEKVDYKKIAWAKNVID